MNEKGLFIHSFTRTRSRLPAGACNRDVGDLDLQSAVFFADGDTTTVVILSKLQYNRPLVLTIRSTMTDVTDPALEAVFRDASSLDKLMVSAKRKKNA